MAKEGENKAVRRRGPPVVGRKRKFGSLRKIMEGTAERRTGIKELETDCLINVLKRTGMESLLLSVPFVCKAWHDATLNPLCWQNLSFPEFLPFEPAKSSSVDLGTLDPFYKKYVEKYQVGNATRFPIGAFVRRIVARSHRTAVEIKLPGFVDEETLKYVADSCPRIRVLSIRDDLVLFKHTRVIAELIGKFKDLEELHLGGNLKMINKLRADLDIQKMYELFVWGDVWVKETIMEDILEQVRIHCKNFIGFGISHAYKLDVVSIVKSLPNVKYLRFEECHLEMDNLHTVLNGCKQLKLVSVAKCEKNSIVGCGLGKFAAESYGVEFVLERGEDDEDGEGCYYSLDAQIMSRKSLSNRGRRRHPRMRIGGWAPRGKLAHRT